MDTDSWFSPPLRWPPTAWYRTTERSESHARPVWSRTLDVQPAKVCVPRLAQTWSLSQKIILIWMIKIMNSLRTYFFFFEKACLTHQVRPQNDSQVELESTNYCQIIKLTGWWCQPLWKSSGEQWSSNSYGFSKCWKSKATWNHLPLIIAIDCQVINWNFGLPSNQQSDVEIGKLTICIDHFHRPKRQTIGFPHPFVSLPQGILFFEETEKNQTATAMAHIGLKPCSADLAQKIHRNGPFTWAFGRTTNCWSWEPCNICKHSWQKGTSKT